MKLLTKPIHRQLLRNRIAQDKVRGTEKEIDFVPVVKLFTPDAGATWLLTEIDNYGRAFGLCDLGCGFPELGYVSVEELEEVKGPLGLKVERDQWFKGNKKLSEYAKEAREKGRIVA